MSATEFTVACIQTDPEIGRVRENLDRQHELIAEAVNHGAKLVVLPECSTSGYMFETRAEAVECSELLGEGPATTSWIRIAKEASLHLVAGIVERSGDVLYNSAVLIGPLGILGVYRKVHLWEKEKEIYAFGDFGFPVVSTPLGRIGMQICYDAWFPESFRLPALQGADIICSASNWVPVPTQPDEDTAMATLMCRTGAHSNVLYVAACSRVGTERGQRFIGRSVIVDHLGQPLAGPASGEREETVLALVDPIGNRDARRTNPFNHGLRDRRTDTYAEMLGSAHTAGEY